MRRELANIPAETDPLINQVISTNMKTGFTEYFLTTYTPRAA
jgi:hypothetical protein